MGRPNVSACLDFLDSVERMGNAVWMRYTVDK